MNIGAFYSPSQRMECDCGRVMTFGFEESRGYRWRCNGRQLNGVRVCNGSRIPLVKDSIFAYKNTPIHDIFAILYFWLVGTKMGQMETLSGCSAKTVRAVVKCIQRMLQQDLDEQSDCCIGKLKYFFKQLEH